MASWERGPPSSGLPVSQVVPALRELIVTSEAREALAFHLNHALIVSLQELGLSWELSTEGFVF